MNLLDLRSRVLGALAGLLIVTVLGAWAVAFGTVSKPLLGQILKDRVDLAAYIADEVEAAADPDARGRELGDRLGAEVRISPEFPERLADRPPRRMLERDGREVSAWPGPRTPLVMRLDKMQGHPWLVVWFPTDLRGPPRRVAIGMILLGLAALGLAVVATWWVVGPAEAAVAGMRRMAEGDLDARLPEGADLTGQMGAGFNRMATRIHGLVEGQRRLLAGVSHEVRSPLARVRVSVELLRDQTLPAAAEARLSAITADIDEVDGLVGELLESARLDRGVIALRPEPLDLPLLMAEVLGTVDVGEHPIQLEIALGLQLQADRARLLRALCNLVSNAVRYTDADAEITLRAAQDPDSAIRLSVADRGPGVPDDALPKIFEPFFRVDESRTRETGGLGLGLMLVRQIAEAHGGRVSAENRLGGGLAVHLVLPARQP